MDGSQVVGGHIECPRKVVPRWVRCEEVGNVVVCGQVGVSNKTVGEEDLAVYERDGRRLFLLLSEDFALGLAVVLARCVFLVEAGCLPDVSLSDTAAGARPR